MVPLLYVVGDAILFIVGLIITTIIIYTATHIMGEGVDGAVSVFMIVCSGRSH